MQPAARPQSQSVPRHVAIIMDGNGRWARARGMARTYGHKRGIEAVRRTVEAAGELGIRCLTLFAFSTENWRRPGDEIAELIRLLRFYLRSEIAQLHENGIRLQVIGDRGRFPSDIVALLDHAETLTSTNDALHLTIALNYGARQEIVAAVRRLTERALAGQVDADEIDEATVSEHLATHGLPDPDLIIRTSGEQRLSNFLLWQAAYSELIFVDKMWPEFGRSDLEQAIADYVRRDRRFGATKEGV